MLILPDAPTGVTTEVSASTVKLNWNPVFLATGGYDVYRSTSASGPYTVVGSIYNATNTTWTDINRSPRTTYFYRVSAHNSAGESAPSAQVSATTLTDNTGIAIAASSSTIVIEWPQAENLGALDAAIRSTNAVLELTSAIIGLPGTFDYSYSYVICGKPFIIIYSAFDSPSITTNKR